MLTKTYVEYVNRISKTFPNMEAISASGTILEQLKHIPKIKRYWELYSIMVENNKGK